MPQERATSSSDEIGPSKNGPWEPISSNKELQLATPSKLAKKKKSNSTLLLMASGVGVVVVLVVIKSLLPAFNAKPTPQVNEQQVVALDLGQNNPDGIPL